MKQSILRTLFLTIGMGCLSLPAIGQKPKVFPDYTYVYEPSDSIQMTIFDDAQYRAYYEKQYRDDPSVPQAYHWMQVLQIGRNYQAFLDYGELRSDSIWNASVKARKKYGEFEAEDKAASRDALSHLKLIFDRSKGMINAHERIFINKYHYTEPIPQLQWTMARGDSTILGYLCHKATTRFRGRDYVAWYTEEIPFPYGPYACRLRESSVRGLHLRGSATYVVVRDQAGSGGEAPEELPRSARPLHLRHRHP